MTLNLSRLAGLVDRLVLDDVVEFRERAGEGPIDQDTGLVTVVPGDLLWRGECSYIPAGRSQVTPLEDQVEADTTESRGRFIVPLACPRIPAGSVAEIVGSSLPGGPRDPHIVGAKWTVVEVPDVATQAVVRTVYVEAVG